MPIRTKLAVCFIGLTLLAVCLAGAGVRPQAQSSRPNILLLMADDWGWPHAGAYGDKVVKTPTFDRVAREGALFTNAFSASPSCTPSRASLLTGRA
ncbi:MAG TPA: sulfatase-like hydrolase/transferase, partial [Blastocatellia bacterium]|nr:sulfatase-like hydrolase/transferase [Blastocatellia bacterium]